MLVNYVQIAYVLGITPQKAKLMMQPYVERFQSRERCERVKPITREDQVESSQLKIVYHHPSIELDGKDKIAYIIGKLQEGAGYAILKKKIVEDMACLKAGKIAGKYRSLLQILRAEDIEDINDVIKRKRAEFLQAGGVFRTKKQMKGL